MHPGGAWRRVSLGPDQVSFAGLHVLPSGRSLTPPSNYRKVSPATTAVLSGFALRWRLIKGQTVILDRGNSMPRFASPAILIAVLGLCSQASAFNEAGHMIVAKMVYDQLSEAQQNAIFAVLQQHPHRAEHFETERPTDVSEKEWFFLRSATWSDFVRPPRGTPPSAVPLHPIWKYHRGPWHYINFPYQRGEPVPATLPAALHAAEADHTDVLLQIPVAIEIVKGTTTVDPGRISGTTDAQNRAVRFCWLMHLLGDLHQPLHVTALLDPVLPGEHDDQGGNLFTVRLTPDGIGSKLHAFWDGRISGNVDYVSVKTHADALWNDPVHAPASLATELAHTTVNQWAEESYHLAIEHAYMNGTFSVVPWKDEFGDDPSAVPATTPTLDAAYKANAKAVAKRQGVLAAHRTLKVLQDCFPAP